MLSLAASFANHPEAAGLAITAGADRTARLWALAGMHGAETVHPVLRAEVEL